MRATITVLGCLRVCSLYNTERGFPEMDWIADAPSPVRRQGASRQGSPHMQRLRRFVLVGFPIGRFLKLPKALLAGLALPLAKLAARSDTRIAR